MIHTPTPTYAAAARMLQATNPRFNILPTLRTIVAQVRLHADLSRGRAA